MKAPQVLGLGVLAAAWLAHLPGSAAENTARVSAGPSDTIVLSSNSATVTPNAMQVTPSPATTLAHLEAVQRNLMTALDALSRATTNNKGGFVEKSLADINLAMTDLAKCIQFAKTTPGLDAQPTAFSLGGTVALAAITNAQRANLGIAPNLFVALNAFNSVLAELQNTPGGSLGGNRDKVIADLALATTDVINGINVAASPAPTTFPSTVSMPRSGGPVEWATDLQMNNYFTEHFVASNGFGASRVSMLPMAFNDSMQLAIDDTQSGSAWVYRIESLELIGIAMHSRPAAFVTQLHQARTTTPERDLTDFEKKSLASLAKGVEVTTDTTSTGGRLVVGAVRAQQSCLQCHPGAKVGDMLGAFTYHLSLTGLRNSRNPAGHGGSI